MYEYSKNLSKVFSEQNKNLSWKELMHMAIMEIVSDYDYYKNAFSVFDYSTYTIHKSECFRMQKFISQNEKQMI